jgi:hypothetical protein
MRSPIEHVFTERTGGGTRMRARARLLAIVLIVAAFLLVVPGLAKGDGPERPAPQAHSQAHYVVQPGDTLWSIARRVAPDRDPRPVVDEMLKANDLHGGLQAGQELVVAVPAR